MLEMRAKIIKNFHSIFRTLLLIELPLELKWFLCNLLQAPLNPVTKQTPGWLLTAKFRLLIMT